MIRGYLTGNLISQRIAGFSDTALARRLLDEGVAAAIRNEAGVRGVSIT